MGDSANSIPVVDFSAYCLSLDEPDQSNDGFKKLVQNVHRALTTIGFFYVVNADFPQEKVSSRTYRYMYIRLNVWFIGKDTFI